MPEYHSTTVLWYIGSDRPCVVLSALQVSKAARQEKKFQDYNERCTFHNQAKVRSHGGFPVWVGQKGRIHEHTTTGGNQTWILPARLVH